MRRQLGLKRSRRKKLSEAEVKLPPATSAPINVTVQAPADTAQGTPASAGPPQSFDRREALRRPSADDPARGGSLSDGWQLGLT